MALKDTAKKMTDLLESIQQNLLKAEKGNKAAAQRVRTESIKLEKIAKVYCKESIKAEKMGLMKKSKAAAKKAKAAAKKPVRAAKTVAKKACTKRTCATKAKVKPTKKAAPKTKVKTAKKTRSTKK